MGEVTDGDDRKIPYVFMVIMVWYHRLRRMYIGVRKYTQVRKIIIMSRPVDLVSRCGWRLQHNRSIIDIRSTEPTRRPKYVLLGLTKVPIRSPKKSERQVIL